MIMKIMMMMIQFMLGEHGDCTGQYESLKAIVSDTHLCQVVVDEEGIVSRLIVMSDVFYVRVPSLLQLSQVLVTNNKVMI